jgi:hypothetical protein
MIAMKKISFYWICVSLILIARPVAAQNPNSTGARMVILERSLPRPLLPDDPVKIVKVLFDGVEVKTGLHALPADTPGVPFQAGDDWFNHLTVVLKNISAKKIVYADIQIFFPALAEGNEIGERPEHARYFQGSRRDDPAHSPILIEPGQEFSLPAIDPARLGEVRQAIESQDSLSAVTSVRLELGMVYFEDGTKWAGGVHYSPDYALPGKYVRVPQKEFDAYRQEVSQ